ncbi:MAG TPA: AMP-binding protein, partial [Pusillimonas sp.]|uniref:AMP-binding protein n=1 Tax=Pusillimonas sp. TaxID=3040095 RepID=UPI002BB9B9BC
MSATYSMPHVWPTVVHMLADAAQAAPDHVALQCGSEQLSYTQYAACVGGLAAELKQAGLGEGERVVVFMANSLDVAIAIFGVQAAGAQVVPMNPLYTAAELAQVFENAQARGIIYDEAAQPVVAQLLAGFDLALCIGNGPGSQRLTRWRHEPQPALPLPQPQWPAILQYT